MFDRIRQAFAGTPSAPDSTGGLAAEQPMTSQQLARWVAQQNLSTVPHGAPGHFEVRGEVLGMPWRLECGASTRDYILGLELRGRADVDADPDAAVLVLNRPLREALESHAYSAITDGLQTSVDARLPEEMRWLSMFDEVSWPELPGSFRQHFVVVAERIEHAERWIHAHLVSELLNAVEGEQGSLRSQAPMVLMLARGKVYLRAEHTRRTLSEVAHARAVLTTGAQSAVQHLPAPPAHPAAKPS